MPTNVLYERISQIIPTTIDQDFKLHPKAFTRNCKITGSALIAFILSIVTSDKTDGIDIQSVQFFKNLNRLQIFDNPLKAVDRSTITKARNKISWKQFKHIEQDAVELAYELMDSDVYTFHGMDVLAIDGSKYSLPSSDEIKQKYDPDSCKLSSCRDYYPQGLVSTVYDVYRGIPLARDMAPAKASERDRAVVLMNQIDRDAVLFLFDRGYPSYAMFWDIAIRRQQHFLMRCKGKSTFKAVETFVKSGKKEGYITIEPRTSKTDFIVIPEEQMVPIKLRVIRYVEKNGAVSVLLTDMVNNDEITADELLGLYHERWFTETNYGHEKTSLKTEVFHSKSVNGILQEFYAVGVINCIARLLMLVSGDNTPEKLSQQKIAPQFKNTATCIGADIGIFIAQNPTCALRIFKEILLEIKRVKYRRAKEKRKKYPRISKTAASKWVRERAKLAKET